MPIDACIERLLLANCEDGADIPPPRFDAATASKLVARIDGIRLFAHSFSFYLNLTHGPFQIVDIFRFAIEQGLAGVSINIDIGGAKGLSQMPDADVDALRALAERFDLEIALEMSRTELASFERMRRLAGRLGARHIRLRSGYLGRVGDILDNSIADLKRIAAEAERHDLHINFEQHEALKSGEMVDIVAAVGNPRVQLLFDFGNMLNCGEDPVAALRLQAPYVRMAHLKGVRKVWTDEGCGQLGVAEVEDDLPQARLMFELLLLGEEAPQVPVFILEKVVGYVSPPMRRPDDGPDTVVEHRAPSTLELSPAWPVDENLLLERQQSSQQVQYVKSMMATLRLLAEEKSQ